MKIKNYSHEVTLPLTNQKQAARDIYSLMVMEDLTEWFKLVRRPKVNLANATLVSPNMRLGFLVDSFMAAYPRGEGTAGDYRLRTLYAACKTIKLKSSLKRPSDWDRGSDNFIRTASVTQLELLGTFPEDGSKIEIKVAREATIMRLFEIGLINGYADEDECEYWLTDAGIKWVQHVPRILGDRRMVAAVEKGRLDAINERDYAAARRAIVNFSGSDKDFFANAVKIIELFGDDK